MRDRIRFYRLEIFFEHPFDNDLTPLILCNGSTYTSDESKCEKKKKQHEKRVFFFILKLEARMTATIEIEVFRAYFRVF